MAELAVGEEPEVSGAQVAPWIGFAVDLGVQAVQALPRAAVVAGGFGGRVHPDLADPVVGAGGSGVRVDDADCRTWQRLSVGVQPSPLRLALVFACDSGMLGRAVTAEGDDPGLRGPSADLRRDRCCADQELPQTCQLVSRVS